LLSEKFGLKEGWKEFWRADDVDVVQFCGFDNGYFYGILIPALLLAYDPQIKLPAAIMLNEFYRLDGSKFSTSRNHAIWCRELLQRVSLDAVRFYLALCGPESEQTNFTMADFEQTVQRELIDGWQHWLRSLGAKLAREYDGVAPPMENDLTREQGDFYNRLERLIADAFKAYEVATFSPRRAAGVLLELGRAAREFSEAQSRNRDSARETDTGLELAAAKTLAMLSRPIMPGFGARLWRDLGDATPVRWDDNLRWLPAGTRVNNLDQPYFSEPARAF
jgi:methionyl-tRNA synthetase